MLFVLHLNYTFCFQSYMDLSSKEISRPIAVRQDLFDQSYLLLFTPYTNHKFVTQQQVYVHRRCAVVNTPIHGEKASGEKKDIKCNIWQHFYSLGIKNGQKGNLLPIEYYEKIRVEKIALSYSWEKTVCSV